MTSPLIPHPNNFFILSYNTVISIRKDTSMPIRAGVFFDMFPFCILYEVTTNLF